MASEDTPHATKTGEKDTGLLLDSTALARAPPVLAAQRRDGSKAKLFEVSHHDYHKTVSSLAKRSGLPGGPVSAQTLGAIVRHPQQVPQHVGGTSSRVVGFEDEEEPRPLREGRSAGGGMGQAGRGATARRHRLQGTARGGVPRGGQGPRSHVMRGLPRGACLAVFSGAHAEVARKVRALGFPARQRHDRLGGSCDLTLRKVRRIFFQNMYSGRVLGVYLSPDTAT